MFPHRPLPLSDAAKATRRRSSRKWRRAVVTRRASPYLDHVVGRGVDLFRLVCERDLEGIVAKRADSAYDPESAVPAWLMRNTDYTQARDRHELFDGRGLAR